MAFWQVRIRLTLVVLIYGWVLWMERIVGALREMDLIKRETELYILYDCTEGKIQASIDFINTDPMHTIIISKNYI